MLAYIVFILPPWRSGSLWSRGTVIIVLAALGLLWWEGSGDLPAFFDVLSVWSVPWYPVGLVYFCPTLLCLVPGRFLLLCCCLLCHGRVLKRISNQGG